MIARIQGRAYVQSFLAARACHHERRDYTPVWFTV